MPTEPIPRDLDLVVELDGRAVHAVRLPLPPAGGPVRVVLSLSTNPPSPVGARVWADATDPSGESVTTFVYDADGRLVPPDPPDPDGRPDEPRVVE